MKEKELDNCFYFGSHNHKATSSLLGQLGYGFHYYQNFYKSQTKIKLLNNINTKIFYSHKNINYNPLRKTPTDLELLAQASLKLRIDKAMCMKVLCV